MVRGGDAAHELGVVIMKVTLVDEHIDDRFIRVVEIPSMSPAFATMYLDKYLCKSFKSLASRYQGRDLGEPCHIAAGFIKLATPTRGAKKLVR
jgi:hypothetical protein